MKISKVEIKRNKLDANFKLYLFLKELNGAIKLSDNEINLFLETYFSNQKLSYKKMSAILINLIDGFSNKKRVPLLALLY